MKMLTCFGILTLTYVFQRRNQGVDGVGEYSMVNTNEIGVAISSDDDGIVAYDDDVEKISDLKKSQPINSHESFLSYLSKQLRFDYRLAGIAGIFNIQNNLVFLALSNLDAAVFQVTYQLRVLATAYFSVLLLKKELSRQQIVALILLSMGVALVELHKTENASDSSYQVQRRWVGMFAVLGASCTSGAGCVLFEYIVKTGSAEYETSYPRNVAPSLWANQLQLSTFGLIVAVITTIVKDGRTILSEGFFQGYTSTVLLVLIMQGKK
jgi:UDP-sugar transporter A1/2/3